LVPPVPVDSKAIAFPAQATDKAKVKNNNFLRATRGKFDKNENIIAPSYDSL
jgi:hypothetical protein